jgi:ketosteroid isomerase-like protein
VPPPNALPVNWGRAVSDANPGDLVELVRVILAAADRADFDAILSFYAPDAVWEMPEGMGTFTGPTAIRGFWEDWWSSYEHLNLELHEILDLGNGVVFAPFRFGGLPKGSAAEVKTEMAIVYEWARGAVTRATAYFDVNDARAAAERLAKERV